MNDIEMGFNTRLNDYKKDMANLTTRSKLPIGAIYFVVKDLLNDIEKAYKDTLKIESAILEEQDKKEYQE
jgi:hypothetical protein